MEYWSDVMDLDGVPTLKNTRPVGLNLLKRKIWSLSSSLPYYSDGTVF
jgi:hypothetical protein